MKEYQAQADVIRQQHMGQQVIAEVVKVIMTGQGPQQTPQPQSAAGGVTASDAEEDQDPDHPNFWMPESQLGTSKPRIVRSGQPSHTSLSQPCERTEFLSLEMSEESEGTAEQRKRGPFLETLLEKTMKMTNEEELDADTTGVIE